MIDLPEPGQRVRVWPAPGRRVQLDARPVANDRGGRYLEYFDEGQEVVWSPFHLEQLRAGDIFLHALRKAEPDLAVDGTPPTGDGGVGPLAPSLETQLRRGRRGKE